MKNFIVVSLFLLSTPVLALTAAPSSANSPMIYEPNNAPGKPLSYPLERNQNGSLNDIQEEVDPCYDLSGNLLPSCSEKALREKNKRPRKSNGGPQDRLNPRGFRDNNTTQSEQSYHP